MRWNIAFSAVCMLMVASCDASKTRTLERLYGTVLNQGASAEASVITDSFVLVPELHVVLPRPKGPEWRVEKSVDRSSGSPIATVKFSHKDGGAFAAFIAEGDDEEDVRAQVQILGNLLARTCGTQPELVQSGGYDSLEIYLSCPIIPTAEDGSNSVPSVMRACVAVRQKLRGRIIATVGIWPPMQDKKLRHAMDDVIQRSAPLLDAEIGRP